MTTHILKDLGHDLASWLHSFSLSLSVYNIMVTKIRRNSWRQTLGQYHEKDNDCNIFKLFRIAIVVPTNIMGIIRKNFRDETAFLHFVTFGKLFYFCLPYVPYFLLA